MPRLEGEVFRFGTAMDMLHYMVKKPRMLSKEPLAGAGI
jgi:hypothetical protein